MNWDQFAGQWKQYTGKVKERWSKLTDSDLTQIQGKRDQLVGKIQERYGITKEEAHRQLDEFLNLQQESSEHSARTSGM